MSEKFRANWKELEVAKRKISLYSLHESAEKQQVCNTGVQMNPLDRNSEELGKILPGQFHYNVKFVASISSGFAHHQKA